MSIILVPDVDDFVLFPPFLELPESGAVAAAVEASEPASEPASESTAASKPPPPPPPPPALLAQVKDNMTINKPTLVLQDRIGQSFALVFDGLERDGFDLEMLGFRPGATVLVPAAHKTVPVLPVDGSAPRRPFVRVPKGQARTVRAVPAPLDQVLAAAAQLRRQQSTAGQTERQCGACGISGTIGTMAPSVGGVAASAPLPKRLLKCTGCGETWYCNRACQTTGWTTGHKEECKAIRGVLALWR